MTGGSEESWIDKTLVAKRRVIPFDALARSLRSTPSANMPPAAAISLKAHGRASLRMRLHRQLSSLVDVSPVLPDNFLAKWTRGYEPDVVYSALGNMRMLGLATKLAQCAGCPLVPHFMDDWPNTLHGEGELAGVARIAMNRGLRRMFAHCRGGMTISALMAREYEARYGIEFRDFMNCVDEEWFAPSATGAGGDPVSLAYCGGLHLGRDEVLLHLGEVIEQLNTSGTACVLNIYTPDADRYLSLFGHLPHVSMRSLAPSAVRAALAQADVLVHVESFVPAHIEYTRWSISTKIPECLASGKAILAIGPRELASIRHLESSGAAVIASSLSVRAIYDVAQALLQHERRAMLGACGREFAKAHHRAAAVRDLFRSSLLEWSRVGKCDTVEAAATATDDHP